MNQVKQLTGMRSKRFFVWGLLLFNALVGLMFLTNLWFETQRTYTLQPKVQKNEAITLSAQAFAKSFAQEYLRFVVGEENERIKQLQPYLMNGLDTHGGLDISSMQVNQMPESVQVWDIKTVVTNQSVITVQAILYVEDREQKKRQRVNRFLAIPIQAFGPQKYVVSDIPYYTHLPNIKPNIKKEVPRGTEQADQQIQADLVAFFKGFFQDYATSTTKKINYFSQTKEPIIGLHGLMTFQNVERYLIFKEANQYMAYLNVRFQEKNTGAFYIYPYQVQVKKEQGRWFITNFQHGN